MVGCGGKKWFGASAHLQSCVWGRFQVALRGVGLSKFKADQIYI